MKLGWIALALTIASCSMSSNPVATSPAHPFYTKFKSVLVTYRNLPEIHHYEYFLSPGWTGGKDSAFSETDSQLVSTYIKYDLDTATFRVSGDTIWCSIPNLFNGYLRVDPDRGMIDSANLEYDFADYHIGSQGSVQKSSSNVRIRQLAYSEDTASIKATVSGDSLGARLISLSTSAFSGPYNPHPGVSTSFSYTYTGRPAPNSTVTIQFIP